MDNLSICGLFNVIGIVVMMIDIIIFITFIKVAKKEEWELSVNLFLTLGFIAMQIIVIFILVNHHMIHDAL